MSEVVPVTWQMRLNAPNTNSKETSRTDVTHPWLDTENVSALFISNAGNPKRREVRIGATSDDFNLGEETIKHMHSPRGGEDSNEDDTVLSYTMI